MANSLTGEFDAAMQFSLPAVDRVLAAMHQAGATTPAPPASFPHAVTLRVDDSPPSESRTRAATVVGLVDEAGNAVSNLNHATSVFNQPGAIDKIVSQSDRTVVPPHVIHGGAIDFTHLRGIAQAQLGAPAVSVPDASGSRVSVHVPIRARYLADVNTVPMPEYLRGELQLGLDVVQVTTEAGDTVTFDLTGNRVSATFDVRASNEQLPLPHSQQKILDQFVINTVRSSFRPASATLPNGRIRRLQFKTLLGPPAVLVGLVRLNEASPKDPASAQQVFLRGGDDFAVAVSADVLLEELNRELRRLPSPIHSTVQVDSFFGSFTADYTTALTFSIEFQEGRILLTVDGKAHTESIAPDFDVTVKQAFTLDLDFGFSNEVKRVERKPVLKVDGDPDVNVNVHGPAGGLLEGRVKDSVKSNFENQRRAFIQDAQPQVDRMTALNGYIESFLRTLNIVDPLLNYTAVEVHTDGVVLRGTLEVGALRSVDVAFDTRRTYQGNQSPYEEYSALNSWVPGGRVDRFTWRRADQRNPIVTDADTFVYPHRGTDGRLVAVDPGLVGASSQTDIAPGSQRAGLLAPKGMCLTVVGTRLKASGSPIVEEQVQGTWCQVASVPLVIPSDPPRFHGRTPLTLVSEAGEGTQRVVVSAYVAPDPSPDFMAVGPSMNLIVHFMAGGPENGLEEIIGATHRAQRSDTVAAIVAVVPSGQLAELAGRFRDLLFTDDPEGGWARRLDVKGSPDTCIVDSLGDVVFRHEGVLSSNELTEAVRQHLRTGAEFRPTLIRTGVVVGKEAPDFVFEYAAGQTISLRRLRGQPVLLVFWTSWSEPSLRLLHDLAGTVGKPGGATATILAVNDGEPEPHAKETFRRSKLPGHLVVDPGRDLAKAYGISCWPTLVSLDPAGRVEAIWLGVPTDWPSIQPTEGDSFSSYRAE